MKCLCFRRGQSEASTTKRTIDEVVSGTSGVKFYSYRELRAATQSFSSANKIGEGGFGSVYRGTLSNGTEVAVKVLSDESRQGLREFLTELIMIANLDHENLVKLYGCCVEGNNRILVYGYLENNSLAQTLLGEKHSSIKFSWEARKRIAIDVAKGLAYLHEGLRPHIVHRDIKASNVLLDKDLTAKISDFGLAKLIPPNMTHVSTRVAGTLGYLAPEYAMQGKLNRKADIYSYGVLLLEIICGSRGRDRFFPPGEQYLLERSWRIYEKGDFAAKLVTMVKEPLREDLDIEEACRFFKVALLCTQETPKQRPPMSNVVKMLRGEVDVSSVEISSPGLLTELMNNSKEAGKRQGKKPLFSFSPGRSGAPSSSATPFSGSPTLTVTRISERTD